MIEKFDLNRVCNWLLVVMFIGMLDNAIGVVVVALSVFFIINIALLVMCIIRLNEHHEPL